VNLAATGRTVGGLLEAAAREARAQQDECEWVDGDGVGHTYERYVVPDRDGQGALRGYTSVWVDITARKAAELRIQRLNRMHMVLSNIDATLVRTKNRQELFDETCRVAVRAVVLAWHGSAFSTG
jgi:hypothetical protein